MHCFPQEAAQARKEDPKNKARTWIKGLTKDLCAVKECLAAAKAATPAQLSDPLRKEYLSIFGELLPQLTKLRDDMEAGESKEHAQ